MARRLRKETATAAPPASIESGASFALEPALDLDAASPLRAALVGQRGSDLSIDASAVRHLGGLCAQVLVAASETWAVDGRSLVFRDPSEAFAQGARLLGIADLLSTGA